MMKILNRLFVIAALLTFAQAALATIIIIDNEDDLLVNKTGAWTTSSNVSGFIGQNYEHDGNSGNGFSMDYFIANHSQFFVGLWTIEMSWTSHANRATNTPVFVQKSAGLGDYEEFSVNQTQPPNGGWFSLGDFMLDIGSMVSIDNRSDDFWFLYSDKTDGYVIADAFRFTSKSTSVSEPGALALLGLGLVGLGFRRRMAR